MQEKYYKKLNLILPILSFLMNPIKDVYAEEERQIFDKISKYVIRICNRKENIFCNFFFFVYCISKLYFC